MVRSTIPLLLVSGTLLPAAAFAGAPSVSYPIPLACSTDLGEANVNEIKSKGGGVQPTLDFAEFKVLQDNVDITGWQICGSDQQGSIECFDIGVGDGTWFTVAQTGGLPDDTQSVYNANTWITYSFKKLKAEEGEVLLLDEFGNVMDYIRWSNQAGICTSTNFSWDVPDACGSCFDQRDPNQKDFARGPDGTGGWGNNGDEPTEGATNDEEVAADHFAIIHDGNAVNCQAEPVTIEAHNASHGIEGAYAGQIAFDTSTLNGDWTAVSVGAGTLINNGNGSGTYQFVTGDSGSVTLLLHDSFVESVNINISDGVAGEAVAEDPDLAFARSGFAFRVNGAPGVLPEQIAGKPSNAGHDAVLLELEAINTNDDTGACEALLTGNVNIDLALECDDPASCASTALDANGVTVAANDDGAVSSWTTVPLDFGDALDTTAELVLTYHDVGRVTLHSALNPAFVSGETLNGSTSFLVRPFGFDITATGNPGASDANGPVFTSAGVDFTVALRALAWQAGDDVDNDGIPDGHDDADVTNNAVLSDNPATPAFGTETVPETAATNAWLVAPTGGVDPGLSGTTTISTFAAGVGETTLARFDETGIIEILAGLSDGSYLGGEDVPGASGTVGRFIPAYFDVAVVTEGCADAGGFTYSAQPLPDISITARAGNGSETITENHDGSLGFAKPVSLSEANGVAGSLSGSDVNPAFFTAGVASLPGIVSFTFTDPATTATDITFRATDTDGVSSNGWLEEGTEIRSGRFLMSDVQAITISDARVTMELQTWQETSPGVFGWMVHADDATCTIPQLADFTLDDAPADTLFAADTNMSAISWSAGSGSITVDAPMSGSEGAVTVNASALGSWFDFDYRGTGIEAPSSIVTFFEIFEREEGLIDQHEIVD